MTIEHACFSQLRLSLMGPGPNSGSPNFHSPSSSVEIWLLTEPMSDGGVGSGNGGVGCVGGTRTFDFNDTASTPAANCCHKTNGDVFTGVYKPSGQLAQFVGASMEEEWTLIIEDLYPDNLNGQLLNWSIDFVSSPCVPVYSWTNVTAELQSGVLPPLRYQAKSIAFEDSFFMWGGRDENDLPLDDLYRYDKSLQTWTQLTPVNFNIALDTASSVGASFMLTSWGLMRYGGYYRNPKLTGTMHNYVSDVYMADLVTMRWQKVEVETWPLAAKHVPDTTIGAGIPAIRYLSGGVFIPSSAVHWEKSFSYRSLYDQHLPSIRSNYIGAMSDSIAMFGGFNGATGSTFDGSTGGLLNDMWMLRLANWSTPGNRADQQSYLKRNCAWRKTDGGISAGTTSCMGSSLALCDLRDMLLYAWCSENNQTMA